MKTFLIPTIATMLAVSATGFIAEAKTLSPEEALSLAMENTQSMKIAGSAQSFKHVHTEKSVITGQAGAYVFDAPSGFVVLATDDTMESLVLGYADEGTFSDAEQAPGLQWWLEAIAAAVDMEAGANEPNGASSSPRIAAAISDRADVEPMLTTKWGQDAPYNDMCPLVNGKRTMTGCVATALAQIMKYHNWPPKGEGEYSYTSSNGVSASANFGATTYRWGDMLDEYDRNSSASAKSAVAEIMYHCGVASEAKYGVDATGAQDLLAALGVYRHLPMSKSMTIQKSIWYEREVWDEMLYEQIAEGTPVYMSGTRGSTGHAFVLDGYKEGKYHVNWGWNGYGNGYFDLRALNPNGGEGIQDTSYNGYEAKAILNARAPREGDEVVHQVAMADGPKIIDRIHPSKEKKWYKTTDTHPDCNSIQIEPAHYSYILEATPLRFGLHIFNENEEHWILSDKEEFEVLEPYTGYGILKIPADNFPNGEWQAWPAFESETQGWSEIKHIPHLDFKPLVYIATATHVSAPPRGYIGPDSLVFPEDTIIARVNSTIRTEGRVYPLDCSDVRPICETSDSTIAIPWFIGTDFPYSVVTIYTKHRGYATINAIIEYTDVSASFVVHVVGLEQSISCKAIPDIITTGSSIDLEATASSGLPVTYSIESETECAHMDGSRIVTTAPGGFTIKIEQIGDTIYEAAPPITQAIRIKEKQAIVWEQDFGNITEGECVELTATASSGLGVLYEITEGADLAEIEGNKLTTSSFGEITIMASQPGSDIYMPAENITKKITIKKKPVLAESIILSETSLKMTIGDEIELTGQVLPLDTTDPTLSWRSGDQSVAIVESGVITAVGAGETTITATCGNASATCAIAVRKKSQAIVWEQDFGNITEGDCIELAAEASSGLEVGYAIIDGNLYAYLTGNTLTVNQPGIIVVEASQPGNSEYSEAEPKRVEIIALAGIYDITKTDITLILEGNAVQIKNNPDYATAYIYDLTGKLLFETNSNEFTLNTGTYLILVQNKVFKTTIK